MLFTLILYIRKGKTIIAENYKQDSLLLCERMSKLGFH